MKFYAVLAVFLSVAAVASASLQKEACRKEWCDKNEIQKTTIDGKDYCCIDSFHRYMIVEWVPQGGNKLVKRCFCRLN
ncbi:hypothetical protein RRG08_051589 [Elysia crispata]|uniref:Uncharacterized protein n=1 Tax=Elysia crispata TaxID=231223 RepID=A0AAE1A3Q6_9GAST|nr:hypothetical protein RRG08_051589 [Elysia crispata]